MEIVSNLLILVWIMLEIGSGLYCLLKYPDYFNKKYYLYFWRLIEVEIAMVYFTLNPFRMFHCDNSTQFSLKNPKKIARIINLSAMTIWGIVIYIGTKSNNPAIYPDDLWFWFLIVSFINFANLVINLTIIFVNCLMLRHPRMADGA